MGPTKRLLSTRKEENQANIKKEKNLHIAISKHILENTDHNIDWKNIKILHKEAK